MSLTPLIFLLLYKHSYQSLKPYQQCCSSPIQRNQFRLNTETEVDGNLPGFRQNSAHSASERLSVIENAKTSLWILGVAAQRRQHFPTTRVPETRDDHGLASSSAPLFSCSEWPLLILTRCYCYSQVLYYQHGQHTRFPSRLESPTWGRSIFLKMLGWPLPNPNYVEGRGTVLLREISNRTSAGAMIQMLSERG